MKQDKYFSDFVKVGFDMDLFQYFISEISDKFDYGGLFFVARFELELFQYLILFEVFLSSQDFGRNYRIFFQDRSGELN